MADQQSEVGLILGLESGPLQRELAKVSNALKGMEKLLNPKSTEKLFKREAIDKYIGGVVELNKELAKTVAMHREIAKIAGSLGGGGGARGGGGGGGPAGGGGSPYRSPQGSRYPRTPNQPYAPHGGGAYEGQRRSHFVEGWRASRGLGSGVSHLYGLRNASWGGRAMGGLGVLGGGVAGALSWLKGKSDTGTAILMANQFASMQSRSLTGRSNSAAVREAMGLGYTRAQGHQIYQATTRARGLSGQSGAIHNMQLARARSMPLGTILDYQQALRHAGGISSETNPQNINDALIKGVSMGGFSRELTGEFTRALIPLIQQRGVGRENVSAMRTAGFLAAMSQGLGGGFARSPLRTAQVIGGLDKAISSNSGNEAIEAFKLRAVGYGTSGKSYYAAAKQLSQGATAKNVRALLGRSVAEAGGNIQEASMMLASTTGLPLWQTERLARMQQSNPGVLSEKRIAKVMQAQPSHIGAESRQASRSLGLQRREIQKGEEFAALRSKLDKVYETQHKMEMMLIKEGGEIGGKLINAIEKLISFLSRLG